MEFTSCKALSEHDKLEILELWNNEYPENVTYKSIREFETYLDNLTNPSHLVLRDPSGIIRGWYVDFIREEETWFAIVLDSKLQGNGYGSQILTIAKTNKQELNGWVVDHQREKKKNGDPYKSPLNFYIKNGFKTLTEERLEKDGISAVKINWKSSSE